MKWSKQSTVYGKKKHKNTTEDALLLLVDCREYAIKFRGLSSVCVYVSDLHIFHTDPLVIGQNGPHRHCLNTLLLLRERKRRKKCNQIKTSFFSQQVQHALEQKI